jgi:hypothetical protein
MTAAERFKERIANLERLRYREAIDLVEMVCVLEEKLELAQDRIAELEAERDDGGSDK